MIPLLALLVWGICGFLNYGIDKGKHRDFLRWARIKFFTDGYAAYDEARHWIVALMGPVWLLATLINVAGFCFVNHDLKFWRYLSFCLKIPKDLK